MVLPGQWLRVAVAAGGCLTVGACGGGTSTSSPEPVATSRIDRMDAAVSALGPSYTYDLTATCGERSLVGRFRVTVRNGEAVAARPLGDSRGSGRRPGDFPTLAGLVDEVRDARPGAVVRLTTGDTGLPVVIGLDPVARAIDDEECYRVARVRDAQDENSR
jgi:hypothetical protein